MRTISNTFTVFIHAKPDHVFDYVADLTRHSEWNAGLKVEAVASNPMGTGAQYHSWGKPGNRLNKIKIVGFQPPIRFTFVASQAGFSDVRHEFVVRPEDDGTKLDRTVTTKMPLHTEILWRMILWPLFDRPAIISRWPR